MYLIGVTYLFQITYLNENPHPLSLIFLLIFNMLGCLTYFSIARKTGSTLFVWLVISLKSTVNFFYNFNKDIVKCFSIFFFISNGFTVLFQNNGFLMKHFLRKQRTCCFPKFSIIRNNYVVYLSIITSFGFSQQAHTNFSLLIIKTVRFFCLLF